VKADEENHRDEETGIKDGGRQGPDERHRERRPPAL